MPFFYGFDSGTRQPVLYLDREGRVWRGGQESKADRAPEAAPQGPHDAEPQRKPNEARHK